MYSFTAAPNYLIEYTLLIELLQELEAIKENDLSENSEQQILSEKDLGDDSSTLLYPVIDADAEASDPLPLIEASYTQVII